MKKAIVTAAWTAICSFSLENSARSQTDTIPKKLLTQIEAVASKQLVDPYSAHWRVVASTRHKDGSYTVCGMVNARNRMGGYGGETMFNGRAGGTWPKPTGSVSEIRDENVCTQLEQPDG